MKRVLLTLIALIFVLSSVLVLASCNKVSQGLKFELNSEDTYTCVGLGDCTDGEIVIPSRYNGKAVEVIGSKAFKDCKNLTSVTIPKSVHTIEAHSFSGCENIRTINLTKGLIRIGSGAFYNCSRLQALNLPNSVYTIGDVIVAGCSSLKELTIDKGSSKYHSDGNCLIETEKKKLVVGCKSSVIPSDGSVTQLGVSAFAFCKGLYSISIPASISTIFSGTFMNCGGLSKVTFAEGSRLEDIGAAAFADCISLMEIELPDKMVSIWDSAFSGCTMLQKVVIPESILRIRTNVFENCVRATLYFKGDALPEFVYPDWNVSECPTIFRYEG